MSSFRRLSGVMGTSVATGLVMLLVVVFGVLGAPPASGLGEALTIPDEGVATVALEVTPAPPGYVLNEGPASSRTVFFGWLIEYSSSGDFYRFYILDPEGAGVTDETSSIGDDEPGHRVIARDIVANPREWAAPADSAPGTYTACLDFYSKEAGLEASASVSFWVHQPLGVGDTAESASVPRDAAVDAWAMISLSKNPSPPDSIPNVGSDAERTEKLGWRMNFNTTGGHCCDHYDVYVVDAGDTPVGASETFSGGCTSPIERDILTDPYKWVLPAGEPPGTYWAVLDFYSTPNPGHLEDSARVAFSVEEPRGNLSILKFYDDDKDCVRDPDEPGIDGWHFIVTGPSCPGSDAWTVGGGWGNLTGLLPGQYIVMEVLPPPGPGWRWVNSCPLVQSRYVQPGGAANVTFGNFRDFQAGNLTIFKYHDMNRDGNWDPGEEGLDGWRFNVWGPTNSWELVTSGGGYATLTAVDAGLYAIDEIPDRPLWANTDPGKAPPEAIRKTALVGDGTTMQVSFGNRESALDEPPHSVPAATVWGVATMVVVTAVLLVWTVRRRIGRGEVK